MNYVLTGLLSFAFLLSAGAGGYRQYTYRFGDHFPPTTFEGNVVHLLGMRVLNLGGFAAALGDAHEKQVMWARLKKIPPLGEPF